ncbi:putative reverse transcriptase domain-containing protein, partial [Tanacetum coccineum]
MPCRTCINCNRLGHFAKDCRARPRMVNPLNAKNPTAACGACFNYEIEIASGQLVEINKAICGCKLEIEGHTFDIDLIPFGHRSFDVIVEMEWLSRHKAEIVCHEKVVKIPLPHGEMLRVLGERPEENVRYLMNVKAKEHKLKDIVIVRNFSESRSLPIAWRPLKWRSCRVKSENSRTRVLFYQVHRRGEHR